MSGNVIYLLSFTEPCTVDKELMSRHNIRFRYMNDKKLYSEHGDTMEFVCTGGTRHDRRVGMRQQCIHGQVALPTCH